MGCEVLIVGGGVVGLALASTLARDGREVALVERESRFGTHTSSRHSEVIHAGIYYEPRSLKAETCVEGRRALYRYLDAHHIEYQKISKLIFASGEQGSSELTHLYQRGLANGVEGLSLLSSRELKSLEPALQADHAILSEETGIFDSHAYLRSLEHEAAANGAMLAVNTSFEAAHRSATRWRIALESDGHPYSLEASHIVNCAGHGAHEVARRIEGYRGESLPSRYLARGSYWSTTQKLPFKRLLYPMPSEAGLGIHLTFDLAGAARFGPDVEWVDYEDYAVPPERKRSFELAVQEYFPELDSEALTPSYAGVRPKVVGPGEPSGDFVVQTSVAHGAHNVVSLFGIESPGLTASLSLAERVRELLG